MEYSNIYLLSGLWANLIETSSLVIHKTGNQNAINLKELSENFENNYRINKLENAID